MEPKFSNQTREVIRLSKEEALRLGHDMMLPEHLLLGIIRDGEGQAINIMKRLGVDIDALRDDIETSMMRTSLNSIRNLNNIEISRQVEQLLRLATLQARHFKSELIGTEHLMLSILSAQELSAKDLLERQGITYDNFRDMLRYQAQSPTASSDTDDNDDDNAARFGSGSSSSRSEGKGSAEKSRTPVLDNFGRDLTRMAEDGKLDPS